MLEDIETVLVSENSLQRRVVEIGKQIDQIYQGDEIVVISIVNGAVIFTADLMRAIKLPVMLDCLHVSSYKAGPQSFTEQDIAEQIHLNLRGRSVLLIDDILDTGLTLQKVHRALRSLGPRDIRTCVLLRKQGRQATPFLADIVGFDVPDEAVVGYGIDYSEKYRNMPFIGILRPECMNTPIWV
ncbi:MAG: hypoxanthine phosphoribosyltransferase [Opitutales bacterium]|nr:hypoxanthine phosphoribosyltransferase [Opitutales bacterium]NRA26778.1 hypoxanthine phosphoribosyltransferase [Opitutales bacterium]